MDTDIFPNMPEFTELSQWAKGMGIITPWRCFENMKCFDRDMAIVEICKRIEKIEKRLDE